ncbi:MAG: hypothetical protein AAGF78_02995 [Pseudomonadota bacterium]
MIPTIEMVINAIWIAAQWACKLAAKLNKNKLEPGSLSPAYTKPEPLLNPIWRQTQETR